MAKDDVIADMPATVPTKRKALKEAPDVWLAIWASDKSLPPSQRKRAQAERDERKAAVPDRRVGLLLGQEGLTPEQFDRLKELLATSGATEVHHPGVASRVHTACRSLGVPVMPHRDVRVGDDERAKLVCRALTGQSADRVYAFPPAGRAEGLWDGIRYAKHRSIPVIVVLPDGSSPDET
jgi:hypothetical protein